MNEYKPQELDKKWQQSWQKKELNKAEDFSDKDKRYVLIEFPYPSGDGLHVGHCLSYIAQDVVSRYYRLQGFNVLYPIGWDAFGLPAENYAIKHKIHPREAVAKNIANFKRQIMSLGISFDWSREINTTDPKYYKWTQWIFLQLFKAGLAEKKEVPINWCPSCKIGLAFEEVVDGKCERCGTEVEQRTIAQWILKITKYADRLIDDLETVDYLPHIKQQQINWIGRSEGLEIDFTVSNEERVMGNEGKGRVILMHGKDADPDSKWYPWFKKQAQAAGFQIDIPVLPKADQPVLADWMAELDQLQPDEETILIGHSRGGVAILRWLERLTDKRKVKKVILIATNRGDQQDKESNFYIDGDYNIEKIKQHCKDFTVIHSRDDEWVPFEAGQHNAEILGAKFIQLNDRGHFGHKVSDIPELLDELFGYKLQATSHKLNVFTTRPDTIYGATFLVIAPEHPLVHSLESQITNLAEVKNYIEKSGKLSERERQEKKEKTGVQLKGVVAVHPITHYPLPIFIADYVMMSYATGSIMAVPAHDERDWEFAKKYGLKITEVIQGQEKPNVVMIHGSSAKNSSSDPDYIMPNERHWHGWFENELKKLGYQVDNPLMPTDWEPDYDEWKTVIEKLKVDENTILVGTSAGGAFVLRWLTETRKRIKGLLLVAPALDLEKEDEELRYFGEFDIDSDLKKRLNFFTVFVSDNDEPLWIKNAKLLRIKFGAKLISLENRGHFIVQHNPGNNKFHELLNEVINISSDSGIYTGHGLIVNSELYNGLSSQDGWQKIADDLEKLGVAQRKVNYKLHDWIFSRQHYWGEPIPIIICDKCGFVPLEAKDLPLELPEVDYYEPTDTGESPLAKITDWVNVKCPKCGGAAKRETDTMPNWAGSSWYYLRYCDPHNDKELAAKHKLEYWLPVDLYNGGMEHTTLHLLYSRFWHKFLYDQKIVPTAEPYARRIAHGMILGPDGQKMSKSRGNVITPDEIVAKYGADSLRLYEMFMGEYQDTKNWSTASLQGVYRFLTKVWNYFQTVKISDHDNQHLKVTLNQSIKKITEDFERRSFNTTVSQLMILFNEMTEHDEVGQQTLETFVILMSPLAPHTAEELWQKLGHDQSVHQSCWPKYDKQLLETQEIIMAVQVNGKVRAQVTVGPDETEEQVKQKVLALGPVQKYLAGQPPKKFMYIKSKIISIVV